MRRSLPTAAADAIVTSRDNWSDVGGSNIRRRDDNGSSSDRGDGRNSSNSGGCNRSNDDGGDCNRGHIRRYRVRHRRVRIGRYLHTSATPAEGLGGACGDKKHQCQHRKTDQKPLHDNPLVNLMNGSRNTRSTPAIDRRRLEWRSRGSAGTPAGAIAVPARLKDQVAPTQLDYRQILAVAMTSLLPIA